MAHILIVDDAETLRMELRSALEKAGHTVTEGLDGLDGLQKAQAMAKACELVLADFNMPRMDGLAMIAKLRELPLFATTPILMLTTETSTELKAAGKQLGVSGWAVKPVATEKLVAVIEKLLNK